MEIYFQKYKGQFEVGSQQPLPDIWLEQPLKGSYCLNSVAGIVLTDLAFFQVVHAWKVFNYTNQILPVNEDKQVLKGISKKQHLSELTQEEAEVFRRIYDLGYIMGGGGLQKFVNTVAAIIWKGEVEGSYFIKNPTECMHPRLVPYLYEMFKLALWRYPDADPLVACSRYLERHKLLRELQTDFADFVTNATD